MENLSWVIQRGPKCNSMHFYKTKVQGDLTHRQEAVKTEAEVSAAATSQGTHETLGTWKKQGTLPPRDSKMRVDLLTHISASKTALGSLSSKTARE